MEEELEYKEPCKFQTFTHENNGRKLEEIIERIEKRLSVEKISPWKVLIYDYEKKSSENREKISFVLFVNSYYENSLTLSFDDNSIVEADENFREILEILDLKLKNAKTIKIEGKYYKIFGKKIFVGLINSQYRILGIFIGFLGDFKENEIDDLSSLFELKEESDVKNYKTISFLCKNNRDFTTGIKDILIIRSKKKKI